MLKIMEKLLHGSQLTLPILCFLFDFMKLSLGLFSLLTCAWLISLPIDLLTWKTLPIPSPPCFHYIYFLGPAQVKLSSNPCETANQTFPSVNCSLILAVSFYWRGTCFLSEFSGCCQSVKTVPTPLPILASSVALHLKRSFCHKTLLKILRFIFFPHSCSFQPTDLPTIKLPALFPSFLFWEPRLSLNHSFHVKRIWSTRIFKHSCYISYPPAMKLPDLSPSFCAELPIF